MAPRFHAPALTRDARTVRLPEDEAAHLARVLRLGPGDAVAVFDGRGVEVAGRVASVSRAGVLIDLGDPVVAAPECRVAITLAQAVLKADKMDAVVRDAVMLGVAAIQPLLTGRTDVPAAAFRQGGRVERWRRVALASTKQCGRAVLPGVHPPLDLSECLAGDRSDRRIILVEPAAGGSPVRPETLRAQAVPSSALVMVGPEGGWTDEEIVRATQQRCLPLTLGGRTLRADAAPLVALSVLLQVWGEL